MKSLLNILLPLMMLLGFSGASWEPKMMPFTVSSISGCATSQIINSNSLQPDNKEFDAKPGQKLSISLISGGAIEISGWDKDKFSAEVEYDESREGKYTVNFSKDGNNIFVTTDKTDENSANKINKVTIKVPVKFDLSVSTNGGPITINNIEGKITGKTLGGPLKLTNLKGYLDLNTLGGPISLTDSDVDGSVHTNGGPVKVVNVKGSVKANSNGGNVIYENLQRRNQSSSNEEVEIHTLGGNIKIDEAPNGAKAKTMGGNINIKNAKIFASAVTMGGNINIDSNEGWVEAKTMSGKILVNLNNKTDGDRHVELRSLQGDVTLTVPKNFSMNVDAEIAYTNNSSQNFKIQNDFGLDINDSEEWDSKKGTPRKYIYGKGVVAGGENTVKISTINGNIFIKTN